MTLHRVVEGTDPTCQQCGKRAGWSPPVTYNGRVLTRCRWCSDWAEYVAAPQPQTSGSKAQHLAATRPPLPPIAHDYHIQHGEGESVPRRFRRQADNEW